MMDHITHAIADELKRLEQVEMDKILQYPPQYTCAAPNVPSDEDRIEEDTHDTDEDGEMNEHIDSLARMISGDIHEQ